MRHIVVVNPRPPDVALEEGEHVLSLEWDEEADAVVEVVVTDRLGVRSSAFVEPYVLEGAVEAIARARR